MNTTVSYRSIEARLGPAEDRYFGQLYRHTGRELRAIEIDALTIRATGALRYPADWSRKAAGTPPAHLSSLDTVAMVTDLAEAYLIHTYGLDSAQRRRCWLAACDMHVRAPQEQLGELAVSAVVTGVTPGWTGTCRSTFDYAIGTIRGTCVVEHEALAFRSRRARYAASEDLLGDPRHRYLGEGYKQRTQRIVDVRLHRATASVEATVAIADATHGVGRDRGFAAAYQPSLSMIDAVVSLGQLAQVLAYELDGIARPQSNTFWMRRLAVRRDGPVDRLDPPLAASLAITRAARLRLNENAWRVLDVSGQIGGIHVEAAVAHQLPAGAGDAASPNDTSERR